MKKLITFFFCATIFALSGCASKPIQTMPDIGRAYSKNDVEDVKVLTSESFADLQNGVAVNYEHLLIAAFILDSNQVNTDKIASKNYSNLTGTAIDVGTVVTGGRLLAGNSMYNFATSAFGLIFAASGAPDYRRHIPWQYPMRMSLVKLMHNSVTYDKAYAANALNNIQGLQQIFKSSGVACGTVALNTNVLPFVTVPYSCGIDGAFNSIRANSYGSFGVITSKSLQELPSQGNIPSYVSQWIEGKYIFKNSPERYGNVIINIKQQLPKDVYLVYTTNEKGIVHVYNNGRERSFKVEKPIFKGHSS